MALSAGEYLSGGQVCDSQGRTVVISEAAGAALSAGEQYSGGYLRDADGRMVICQDTLNSALGAGEVYSGGDVRDSMGRVAVAVDTVNAALSANEQISGGQVRDSLGRRVIAIDTRGAALSAGEFFSGGNVLDAVGRTVVALEAAVLSYDATVLADSPSYFWKMAEPSGTTATDSADANTGTYQPTVTLAQAGPCSDGETAVLFAGGGQITSALSTTTSIASNPVVFSLEVWFKTANAYALGGGLFQFNNLQTGGGASFDRILWLDNSGFVQWRAGSGTGLSNSVAYNNGNWHHVVLTQPSSAGIAILYVDGAQVTSGTAGATSNYTGFWRVGNANTAGFAPGPTNLAITATLAKAAIYPTVLTPTQVAAHYAVH